MSNVLAAPARDSEFSPHISKRKRPDTAFNHKVYECETSLVYTVSTSQDCIVRVCLLKKIVTGEKQLYKLPYDFHKCTMIHSTLTHTSYTNTIIIIK